LVFATELERVADAYALEKQIQGWSRAKKEALIASNFDKLPELSKKDYSKYRGQWQHDASISAASCHSANYGDSRCGG
jgi:hypothetical protein